MVRDSTVLFGVSGLMLAVFASLWQDELRYYTELPVFLLGVATFAFLMGAFTMRGAERMK